MPIAAELSEYTNEAVFTAKFLIPRLHRLGFSVVVNYHGTREFGKDLIFAEIDSFGHIVYHGPQARADSLRQIRAIVCGGRRTLAGGERTCYRFGSSRLVTLPR